jgi:hypothetical protein
MRARGGGRYMNRSFHVIFPAPARTSDCCSFMRFSNLCASSILSLACIMHA